MPSTHRPRRLALMAAMSTAALAAAALTPAATSAATARPAGHHAKPGVVGSPIVLANHVQLDGYDEATDAAGNDYIGWIADTSASDTTRAVHLCTLHPGATSCAGGVHVIDALGASTADGLRVFATKAGQVRLVWFHDTTGSVSGGRGGRIAEATSSKGTTLSPAKDVATAPSFGELFDAEPGPGGAIWTVAYSGLPSKTLEVREGFSAAPENVKAQWGPGFAQLAFAKGTPIISVEKFGAISTGPSYASKSGAHWGTFRPVAHTWAVGTNADLTATRHGVRLITAEGNAGYRPVISRWTGHGFSRRRLTTDNSPCAPSSHDAYSDRSGRLVEVANECGKLAVSDFPDDNRNIVARFSSKGTVNAQYPQIASTARGTAFVAWSVESGSTGDLLRVVRFRLPDRTTSKHKRSSAGTVTVFGPMSCLPAVSTPVRVRARHAHGWTVASKSLRLGKKKLHGSSLNGSKLKAGKHYKLHGSAVFVSGSHHKRVTATLKFTSCPTG